MGRVSFHAAFVHSLVSYGLCVVFLQGRRGREEGGRKEGGEQGKRGEGESRGGKGEG